MMQKFFDHAGICPSIKPHAWFTTRTHWGASIVGKEPEKIILKAHTLLMIKLSG